MFPNDNDLFLLSSVVCFKSEMFCIQVPLVCGLCTLYSVQKLKYSWLSSYCYVFTPGFMFDCHKKQNCKWPSLKFHPWHEDGQTSSSLDLPIPRLFFPAVSPEEVHKTDHCEDMLWWPVLSLCTATVMQHCLYFLFIFLSEIICCHHLDHCEAMLCWPVLSICTVTVPVFQGILLGTTLRKDAGNTNGKLKGGRQISEPVLVLSMWIGESHQIIPSMYVAVCLSEKITW